MNVDGGSVANMLCRDIVRSCGQRGDRQFLVTNFRYPDGDFINLYFYANEATGGMLVTDKGTTLFKCLVAGIGITTTRSSLIESICYRYGIKQSEDGELCKEFKRTDIGKESLRFCEGIVRISNLQFDNELRSRSVIYEDLSALLEREVSPHRSIHRHWFHPDFDPTHDYPVDFHINSRQEPRNIFFIGSAAKSNLTVLVSSFLRLNNLSFPTLAVVDPEVRLPKHNLSRLQRVSTEIRFGLRDYERDVVDFALGGAR